VPVPFFPFWTSPPNHMNRKIFRRYAKIFPGDETMIKGTGADIIEIERLRKAIGKDSGFTERIFSAEETEYCNSKFKKEVHFAGRFAAKEAFFKALGTGWRDGMKWTEIKVVNDQLGKPEIRLAGKTLDIFREKGMSVINLSISHTREFAVAFVVIE
jgi:holo-[acyl-carrier protein] synthase